MIPGSCMTEGTLAFLRALSAPFQPKQFSHKPMPGGGQFTYVRPRVLMNRLDEVCSPMGWSVAYRPTASGLICALTLRVPAGDGTYVQLTKEDGGGYEEMTKRVGKETLPDPDNIEKSGFTNAFRRACTVWGLGRECYREGMPTYLDEPERVVPDAPEGSDADEPDADEEDDRRPAPARERRDDRDRRERDRDQQPARERRDERRDDRGRDRPPARDRRDDRGRNEDRRPPARGSSGGGGNERYADDWSVPPVGKAVFSWAKRVEDRFGQGVIKFMNDLGKDRKLSNRMIEWDQEDVDEVCLEAMAEVAGWKSYKGEFDDILDPR